MVSNAASAISGSPDIPSMFPLAPRTPAATALLFVLLASAWRRTQRLYFEAAKRLEAEEALKHGQRLEALGQLTGGVAHDFNNLLTGIRAAVDLLRRPVLPGPGRARVTDA